MLQMEARYRGLILLLCLFVGLEKDAQAYTDPGTGVVIWQIVVAAFVGGMFYFRRILMKINSFLKKPDKTQ